MAGNALGVTIHDVLSNGFWSAEQRGTERYLYDVISPVRYKTRFLNTKSRKGDNGERLFQGGYITTGPTINGVRWKLKNKSKWVHTDVEEWRQHVKKLTAVRNKTYREKTLTTEQVNMLLNPVFNISTNWVVNSSATYKVKPLKKDVRPMGPLVMYDCFPDDIQDYGLFYGTEEHAVTNIVSDQEAYITRVVEQTGYLDDRRYPINEDASLLRTYNTHITTDEDHVYVDQTIYENSKNNPAHNQQDAYQTQYVATFKKGQWKNSTETITCVSNKQIADWVVKQYQEQTTRISSHQSDHLSQRLKDTQNFR